MLQPEFWAALTIAIAVTAYVFTAGGDFGAGAWLLTLRKSHRDMIFKAMAPVWEANHVWLIVVAVLLFVAFPKAFAALSVALHVPIVVMLLGIVVRGSAFAFLYYGKNAKGPERWLAAFMGGASVIAPFAMGVVIGTASSGNLRVDPATGEVLTGLISPWLSLYPLSVGLLTFFLFAFIGAVYMMFETRDASTKKAFRLRAILSGLLLGWITLVCFALSQGGTLGVQVASGEKLWSALYFSATSFAAIGALMCLITKRDKTGRFLAWAQTLLIIAGWAVFQYPNVVVPDLTISNAAAPAAVLNPLLIALAAGLAVVIPAFGYFYWVFKGEQLSIRPPADIIGPGE